jgi:hypothetical protein
MTTPRDVAASGDAHAQLEKAFIAEFLKAHGYTPETLHDLPPDMARRLMTEASQYASNRLAELETRAHFVEEVDGVSPPL